MMENTWGGSSYSDQPQAVHPYFDPIMGFLDHVDIDSGSWAWPCDYCMAHGPPPAVVAAATPATEARSSSADHNKGKELQDDGRLTLTKVAGDMVALVADRMEAMPEEQLEQLRSELRLILEGLDDDDDDGGRRAGEFLALQELLRGRADLTPDVLEMAHPVQLGLLAAIKTGMKAFMDHPVVDIPKSSLADLLLGRRCRNIHCLSALPADGGCECNLCTTDRKGFCSDCMCIICIEFDSEADARRWIICDLCAHRAHLDCAISGGHIGVGVGHTVDIENGGTGHEKMFFHCQACHGTTQVLKWVRKMLQECAPIWDRDAMLVEISHVCQIFDRSEDSDERKFVAECAELLRRLSSVSDESMCRKMLLKELQGICAFPNIGYEGQSIPQENYTPRTLYFAEMDDRCNMIDVLERILNDTSAGPIELSFAFLESITNDFSSSQVIGSGGFGVVYMGVIRDKKIAVKDLCRTRDFSDKQFHDELACLRRVKHKNIVRFLGYCADTKEEPVKYKGRMVLAEVRRRFLCFEYVPNKNLHNYIKGKKLLGALFQSLFPSSGSYCSLLLTDHSHGHEWDTLCKLVEGICRGLQYLHNNERITHLDLKPENILLDANMVPKITDFGLSRRFSGGQSKIITRNILGSQGYIAPEYWNKGEISYKADIFSLGIVIRKLLCGSIDSSDLENWYQSLDIVNPLVNRWIEISKLCVEDDPRKRPTIDCLIAMLSEKETMIQEHRLDMDSPKNLEIEEPGRLITPQEACNRIA
ncbi:hypothetical protein ACP4OV_002066 [Aristida adscensionis]